MNASKYPPAVFVADAIALDFLNTVTLKTDTPYDWLADGAALLSWLEQAALVPLDVVKAFGADASDEDLCAVALQARTLREWFRAFVEKHGLGPPSTATLAELAPINCILERDAAFRQVVISDPVGSSNGCGDLEWASMRRWNGAEALLIPIAESIARFVVVEDLYRVKTCEGHQCSMIFLDRANTHSRRWCNMARCGNRAKQAKFRERIRVPTGEG
ncbi:CGNR zinc finger domain-containing protein [Dyella humicola]|uniref:CGNR zinc finger domain-containing protein n=1 Tax=Dyella humicola TaxID=2992126 RepID=UPI00225BC4A9|nr:ABATE domain-containing protein [Dyella humicola]